MLVRIFLIAALVFTILGLLISVIFTVRIHLGLVGFEKVRFGLRFELYFPCHLVRRTKILSASGFFFGIKQWLMSTIRKQCKLSLGCLIPALFLNSDYEVRRSRCAIVKYIHCFFNLFLNPHLGVPVKKNCFFLFF